MTEGREVTGTSRFPRVPISIGALKGAAKKFFTNGVDNLELIG